MEQNLEEYKINTDKLTKKLVKLELALGSVNSRRIKAQDKFDVQEKLGNYYHSNIEETMERELKREVEDKEMKLESMMDDNKLKEQNNKKIYNEIESIKKRYR